MSCHSERSEEPECMKWMYSDPLQCSDDTMVGLLCTASLFLEKLDFFTNNVR